MKKAFVTGANGFVGSLLVRELLDNGVEVIAAHRHGRYDRIPDGAEKVEFTMEQISELKEIVLDRDIDVMFHMAWNGSSGAQRGDYSLQLKNAKHTCDAVKIASEMNIKRFVGVGSLAQFDRSTYTCENGSVTEMISCYGIAKTAAQFMSKAVADSLNIDHVWCYISNIYGVGDVSNNFINFACKKMLSGERVAFTKGEQNYDFAYITDVIQGLYLCGKNGKSDNAYYIGSGKARKLKEYITIIRDTINTDIPLYFGEIPYNGIYLPIEKFSCEHIKNDTGYSAKINFEDGIRKTVEWLREAEK